MRRKSHKRKAVAPLVRTGESTTEQLIGVLMMWARNMDELTEEDRMTPGPSPDFFDGLTEAFCEGPMAESAVHASPLANDNACFVFASTLFPDLVPDVDEGAVDALNGFAENGFVVARVALRAEFADRAGEIYSAGASYLMRTAAIAADRLLREGEALANAGGNGEEAAPE